MLKANIEKAENGYILYLYGEGGDKLKNRQYIAKDEQALAGLIKKSFTEKEKKA